MSVMSEHSLIKLNLNWVWSFRRASVGARGLCERRARASDKGKRT
jgi:hypothetical protein